MQGIYMERTASKYAHRAVPRDLTQPVVVFIVSSTELYTHRQVLWRMSMGDAIKVCNDPRAGLRHNRSFMLWWCSQDIDDPQLNQFVIDDGRFDDLLSDHRVTVFERRRAA